MVTAAQALIQVSRDLGDYFPGTTTAQGLATTFKDTILANFNDDRFVNKFDTWLKIISGSTSGNDDGKTRRIISKVGTTATFAIALAGVTPSGMVYQVHKLFTPDEKDDAVTNALETMFPTVFKLVTQDITISADTYDYATNSSSFQNGLPRQAHIISADTEVTKPFFNWEGRQVSGVNGIHFNEHPPVGTTVRLVGLTQPTITNISTQHMLILSARAILFLLEGALGQGINENTQRFQHLEQVWQGRLQERIQQHAEAPPPQMKSGYWDVATPTAPLEEQPSEKGRGEL